MMSMQVLGSYSSSILQRPKNIIRQMRVTKTLKNPLGDLLVEDYISSAVVTPGHRTTPSPARLSKRRAGLNDVALEIHYLLNGEAVRYKLLT